MTSPFATIRRGASFSYSLSGRQAGDSLTAKLKPAASEIAVPSDDVPHVAVFTISESNDVDGLGTDGWIMFLNGAQTATLAAGNYIFDERIIAANGNIDQTEPAILKILERVTS